MRCDKPNAFTLHAGDTFSLNGRSFCVYDVSDRSLVKLITANGMIMPVGRCYLQAWFETTEVQPARLSPIQLAMEPMPEPTRDAWVRETVMGAVYSTGKGSIQVRERWVDDETERDMANEDALGGVSSPRDGPPAHRTVADKLESLQRALDSK